MSDALPWFRCYTDIIDDEVIALLAFEDRWHFVALMAMKGKGVLDKDYPSEDMRDRLIAKKLGLDICTFKDMRVRLIESGLINDDCSPLKWDKRQRRSDQDKTGAARQARHRERAKQKELSKQLRNANSNGAVTRLDTDTDTDKQHTSNSQAKPTDGVMTKADHERVIALYHEVLPTLTPVLIKRWHGSAHAKNLAARWKEDPLHRTDEFWVAFFQSVAMNDWWMARRKGSDGQAWKGCKLSWLVTRRNFDAVYEFGMADRA